MAVKEERKGCEMSGTAPSTASRSARLPSTGGLLARLAWARATAAGVATTPLLTKAGLTLHQIEDSDAQIKVRDQIKLLNLVAGVLNDDLLGFRLAQVPDLREIGLLYYVLASSETLIEALERGARYSGIANEGVALRCINEGEIGLSFRYVGVSRHPDRHQIEFWITSVLRVVRQITGLRLVPARVRFSHHRSRDDELRQYFGDAIVYGADADDITFPGNFRLAPAAGADPYLNKLLVSYCEDAIRHRAKADGSARSLVENAIVPLLPHGKVQVNDVSRRLGMSPRTLARRLAAEGLTFSEILEGLRTDLTKHYLQDGQLAISQVAWLLGYKEAGAFSRAFKRRTGKTPREQRASLR